MAIVYIITNSYNNKCYVGVSKNNLNTRIKGHKSAYKKQLTLIHKEMYRLGFENFHFETLEVISESEMSNRERYWIKKLNTIQPNGYNVQAGGFALFGEENSFYGKQHTQQVRDKLSKLAQQKTGAKNPFYGKSHSKEAKEKIRKSKLGTKMSEESKLKMSKSRTGNLNSFYGKSHTEKTKDYLSKQKQTKDLVATKNGEVLEFEYINDAIKFIRENHLCSQKTSDKSIKSNILKSVSQNRNGYGYKWSLKVKCND